VRKTVQQGSWTERSSSRYAQSVQIVPWRLFWRLTLAQVTAGERRFENPKHKYYLPQKLYSFNRFPCSWKETCCNMKAFTQYDRQLCGMYGQNYLLASHSCLNLIHVIALMTLLTNTQKVLTNNRLGLQMPSRKQEKCRKPRTSEGTIRQLCKECFPLEILVIFFHTLREQQSRGIANAAKIATNDWCCAKATARNRNQAIVLKQLLRSITTQTTALNMLIKRIPWNARSGASSPCSFARNAMISSLFAVLRVGCCATSLSWGNSGHCSEGSELDCQSISLACVKLSCLLHLLRHLRGCQG